MILIQELGKQEEGGSVNGYIKISNTKKRIKPKSIQQS
jgi:hypothetical protein